MIYLRIEALYIWFIKLSVYNVLLCILELPIHNVLLHFMSHSTNYFTNDTATCLKVLIILQESNKTVYITIQSL